LLKHHRSGKFWLYKHCVFYTYRQGMLYIRTSHRGERFTTKWRINSASLTAENVTSLEELAKAKTAGRIPRIAVKVHYAAVKRLGFNPPSLSSAPLQIATCKFKGKCAFKFKVKGKYHCKWPDTCNQKQYVTP